MYELRPEDGFSYDIFYSLGQEDIIFIKGKSENFEK